MSDHLNEITPVKSSARGVCRVAYTLNNAQPVSCTIIGSQPLFYMDFDDEALENEMLFDDVELSVLENEIQSLKKEIEMFDRFAGSFAGSGGWDRSLLESDRDFITQRAAAVSNVTLEVLEETLGKSRMAAAYLDFAKTNNVSIHHSAQIEDAFYDRRAGVIFIHPRFDLGEQLLLAARELRRHWQHRHGALIHPLLFHPDSAVLVNRAQVADLSAAMIRVGWELQLGGASDAWNRIENSPMADLGRAFAYEAFLDFRTLNNGQAAAAVFECWFLSERCRAEDKNLIRQMLADNQGYVFDENQSGKALTPALISALGTMPYGKNYLAGHAQTIIADPLFNEVRDRSNANFLWFIKFERSFRETERELQTEFDIAASGTRPGVFRTQDVYDADAESAKPDAEIIRLFSDEFQSGENNETGDKSGKSGNLLRGKSSARRRKDKAGENVIYLRRWSGE